MNRQARQHVASHKNGIHCPKCGGHYQLVGQGGGGHDNEVLVACEGCHMVIGVEPPAIKTLNAEIAALKETNAALRAQSSGKGGA